MYSENKEKTKNDDTGENEFQTEDIVNYKTDTEENHESDYGEVDLVIDQDLANLSTEAGSASPDAMKNDNRLHDEQRYAGQYTWLYYNLAKYGHLCKICEVFYSDHPCPTGRGRGAWSHNAILLKNNPKRRFQCHKKSSTHLKAILLRTNARMEEALRSAELLSRREKQQTMELYVTKFIKIFHFLARLNLPINEMHPKMIRILSDEMKEPVLRFIFSFSKFLFKKHNLSAYCCSKWCCTLCRRSNICCTKGNDEYFVLVIFSKFRNLSC